MKRRRKISFATLGMSTRGPTGFSNGFTWMGVSEEDDVMFAEP